MLWALLTQRYYLTQNLIWMSILITTHTSRGYEKVYYSHNETFWEQQGESPDLTGLAFIVLRVWVWGECSCVRARCCVIWSSHMGQRRRHPGFLISLPAQMWSLGGKGNEEAWKLSAVKYQKWSQPLYHGQINYNPGLEKPVCSVSKEI